MTIKQKIIGTAMLTALLVATVGLVGALHMLRLDRDLQEMNQTEFPEITAASQLAGMSSRLQLSMDDYFAAARGGHTDDLPGLRANVSADFSQIFDATSRVGNGVALQKAGSAPGSGEMADALSDRNLLVAVEQKALAWQSEWAVLNSVTESRGNAGADLAALERTDKAGDELLKCTLNLQNGAMHDAAVLLQGTHERTRSSVRILGLVAGAAICMSLVLGLMVALPLTARLAKATQTAMEIGKGNLEARIEPGTRDEVGLLAIAFNDMAGHVKRSRDELKESESRFREVAETIREVFWVSDVNCTKIQYVSPAYEQVWGRSCESLYRDSRSFTDAIDPQDRPHVLAALENQANERMDVEYRIIRPDGSMRWIHDRGFGVRDEDGQVHRVVGIAEDITSRKISEAALRQSETMLARAQQVANIGSWDWDLRGDKLLWSEQYYRILDVDPRQFIPTFESVMNQIHPEDRSHVIRAVQRALAGEERYCTEYRLTARDGSIRVVLAQGDVDRDEAGVPIQMVGTALDVTERKKAEAAIRQAHEELEHRVDQRTMELQQANESLRKGEAALQHAKEAAEAASLAKSEFLAKMSHEIRTPLNGVVGITDLLLDTGLDGRQIRFARIIKSSGESLSQLINDILDFSKIEAKKLEIEVVDFDLWAIAEDVIQMLAPKAAQKELELACNVSPEVARLVCGDPERVKQIMVNLVNNAIKFTDAGSIAMRLSVDEQSNKYLTVHFAVTDTGIGIPADRMDRLFKSFSQVDASTTRNYGGTGLGLAIVKQLAELMGGHVGVESIEGRGSTFWFTVKFARRPQGAISLANSVSDRSGLRALVMNESASMREMLRSQLAGWGFDAAAAASNEEVLKILNIAASQNKPYRLSIVDSDVAGTSALELGRAIKAVPELAETLLVVLLPIESKVEPGQLRAAGFAGHLIKPVRQSQFYDRIMDVIATANQPVSLAAPSAAIEVDQRTPDVRHARILLAEDNRVNQIVAGEILSKHGYPYEIAGDGHKALAAALTGGFDLILMDCLMPGMDGFEVTREIRRQESNGGNPQSPRVPIIALTANAIKGDRERCLEAGMDAYVTKPVNSQRLIESIESLLAHPRASMSHLIASVPVPYDSASTMPPLAIDELIERCMGDTDTVKMILNEFEKQTAADLIALGQHFASRDMESAARVAHTLKGASRVVAADPLSGVAAEIERNCRRGDLADAERLMGELKLEVNRCIEYLPAAHAANASRDPAVLVV